MNIFQILKKAQSSIDKAFIPQHLTLSVFSLLRARTLVFIHLFLFLFASGFAVANQLVFHDVETPPLGWGALFALFLIYIFRRFGNFIISGNLLAGTLFILFASTLGETGGLYSDNLLWMLTAPLLALLFADQKSGYFWLVSLLAATSIVYYQELISEVSFREFTLRMDAHYYYTTFLGLFAVVVGIVLIFAKGQKTIINDLNDKKQKLTEQKEALVNQAESLKQAEKLLLQSNKELEQFAYAASHDLKEPLRMIGMYTQLIKKKLEKDADKSTHEYMFFVSDGVTRMEKLLHDLLEYSRLGKSKNRNSSTDLNEVLFIVINNLTVAMREAHAEILSNELPVLPASSTEMIQLFQNLIANSIKFRRSGTVPVISINHQSQDGMHRIQLSDNGIGISEEHREKVFNIFERVHGRKEFEGTGIGLATCKKIVANMGGDIWVEPSDKPGTTFIFTFPEAQQN